MTADLSLIRSSFKVVEPHGSQVTGYFYEHLFANNPAVRPLFAPHLDEQRDRLWAALGALVNNIDNTETLVGMLQNLGRRHAGYGVQDSHYDTVGAALLWTLEAGLGRQFTPEVKEAWATVYGLLATTMKDAARDALVGV